MKICFSDQEPIVDSNSIFLAGPTRRNSKYEASWRKEAVTILKQYGFNGVVYIPEIYEDKEFGDEQLDKQIQWEWMCLDAAGIIVFWVPRKLPDMPGFTTNVEFGIYTEKKPKQVIYGHPADAEKMKYLDKRYMDVTGKAPCPTMEETVVGAIMMLDMMK